MRHFIELFRDTANKHPELTALSNFGRKSYTFSEVNLQVKLLHSKFNEIGLGKGDHIAICGKNSAEWAIAFLSVVSYHAVAVPLLYDFTTKDIQSLVNHSDSIVLFTDTKVFDEIDCVAIRKLRAVINLDDFEFLYKKFGEVHKYDYRPESTFSDLSELVAINYTSGTTGSPKGVMLTAGNISSNVCFGLKRIPVYAGDTIVSMLPLAHMYSLAFEFLYPLCGGANVVFLGKTPSPKILLSALQEVKPYILITVPLVLEKIFKSSIIPKINIPYIRIALKIPFLKRIIYAKIKSKLLQTLGGNIRTIVAGGAAMSSEVEKVMKEINLPYTIGYGMTECAPLLGYEDSFNFKLGSCGKVVDGMDVRIDSFDALNIPGEIQVKGINVTLGYYKNEEATKLLFTDDGWLHTGDLGIIDVDGNIFIKGRSKCMILSSNGQNIYPEEIEDKLNSLQWVQESLVVNRHNQFLTAMVVLKDGFKKNNIAELISETIRSEINKQLPGYSKISKVEIKDEFQHTPKHSIKRFLYS